MKKTIPLLRVGQMIRAEIVETNQESLIVNFNGDLLRIENQSSAVIQPLDQIWLEVQGLSPLRFKLVSSNYKQMQK